MICHNLICKPVPIQMSSFYSYKSIISVLLFFATVEDTQLIFVDVQDKWLVSL